MKYYQKIDGLRFIAISLVLIQHFADIFGSRIYAGSYGVDLFFVISGFLVTTILLRLNEKSFKENYIHFIGRRTLRIFPIYYLTILILWLAGLPVVRENLAYLVTYTFNYASVHKQLPPSPVTHFWSLCVEEQFYLIWPFIILFLKKRPAVLLMLVSIMVLAGYAQKAFGVFPSISVYNNYSSLGLGAIGSIITIKDLLPARLFRNKLFEYFMLLLLVTTLITTYRLKVPVLGLCSLYLVLKAALYGFYFKPLNWLLANKTAGYIGTISYGIYVYHVPLGFYLSKYFIDPFWASINFEGMGILKILRWNVWIIKFPLYTVLSIGLAAVSYKYFEKPILKLKDKFFKY